MARVVLHIGANKTGSTSLQRRLFAARDTICYRGEDGPGWTEQAPLFTALVEEDDLYAPLDAIAAAFAEMRAEAAGRVMVYSNEDISRSPLPTVCADRLARLLPEATVVLVVREQRQAIASWYVNHGAYLKGVPRRYWRRFVGFDEWMEHCLRFPRMGPLRGFDYDALVALYAARFSRVEVLIYEELLTDPAAYAGRWGALLGVERAVVERALGGPRERRRYSRRLHNWSRIRSAWPALMPASGAAGGGLDSLWLRWLEGGPAMRDWMTPAWQARIAERYADGNRRLADRVGLDLQRYGYALAPSAARTRPRTGT